MKRVFLVFSGLMLAGAIMAQQTSTIKKNGTGHNAEVNQSDGDGNASEIIQDQGFNLTLDRGSDAMVKQIGSDNQSDINSWGWNHSVDVNQEGNDNASSIKQSGGENVAKLNQIGNNNALRGRTPGSSAFQKAGDPFGSDMNEFSVDQIGDNNTVSMWQEHSANAEVVQNGNYNESEVFQTGAAYGADNNATILINGNNNISSVSQTKGSGNGDGNNGVIKIGYQENPTYKSNDNQVTIDQKGDHNEAMFGLTKGNANDVNVTQDGNNNYTDLSIKYGDGNNITESVYGDNNRTRVSIDAEWGTMSSNNDLDIEKTGDGNYVSGSIKGSGNDVNIVQSGNDNRLGTDWYTKDGVVISGDNNIVDIQQSGNGNMSLNDISGMNNQAIVVQQPLINWRKDYTDSSSFFIICNINKYPTNQDIMKKIIIYLSIALFQWHGVYAQEDNLEKDEKTLNIISEVVLQGNENQNADLRKKLEVSQGQQVSISQQGDFNDAIVVQQGWGGNASNYAEINQIGDNNHTDVDIRGNNNAVRVLQENLESGIGNTFEGDIHGNSNLVDVDQRGANNTINQTITGDNYNYQVKQHGSNHTLELDNLTPTANPIVIEQTGEGMNLQIDNSFVPVTGR